MLAYMGVLFYLHFCIAIMSGLFLSIAYPHIAHDEILIMAIFWPVTIAVLGLIWMVEKIKEGRGG